MEDKDMKKMLNTLKQEFRRLAKMNTKTNNTTELSKNISTMCEIAEIFCKINRLF